MAARLPVHSVERSGPAAGKGSAALKAEQDGAEPVALGRHRRLGEPAERDGCEQDAVYLAQGAEPVAVELRAISMNIRYRVTLTTEAGDLLERLVRGGKDAVRKRKRAQILLAVDAGSSDEAIAQHVGVDTLTVYQPSRVSWRKDWNEPLVPDPCRAGQARAVRLRIRAQRHRQRVPVRRRESALASRQGHRPTHVHRFRGVYAGPPPVARRAVRAA